MSPSKETSDPSMPAVAGFGASMIVKKIDAAFMAFDAAVKGTEMALRWAIIVMIDIKTLRYVRTLIAMGRVFFLHNQGFNVGEFEVEVKLYGIPKA